jgi:hypothetical protein
MPLSVEGAAAKGGIGILGKIGSFLGRFFGLTRSEGIVVTAEGIGHVLERHGFESLAVDASKFLEGADIPALIRQANSVAPEAQSFGLNFQRIVNAGRIIGTDITTGNPTSFYTVITDRANKLVTTFPGFPTR